MLLTAQAGKSIFILFLCIFLNKKCKDMSIEPWRNAKVIRIENETVNTRRFWLQVPELEVFDFAPGQFVTLDLPIHEKKINAGAVIPFPAGLMVPIFLNW